MGRDSSGYLPSSNDKATLHLTFANDQTVQIFAEYEKIFKVVNNPSREEVVEKLLKYLEKEVKLGTKVNHVMRHTVGLYHGQIGSKNWKRYLSDNMMARNSDFQKVNHIMEIVQNNEKSNQAAS